MDRLVWPTAKAQLYLLEVAHVKNAVGREKIRRNKDALRELRSFQEILSDVHAGEFGRNPERRQAADKAVARWHTLLKAAALRNVDAEQLCSLSSSIKRLLAEHAFKAGNCRAIYVCDAETQEASSTRAPSTHTDGTFAVLGRDTDQHVDAQSFDDRCSDASTVFPDSGLLGNGYFVRPPSQSRMSQEQLDRLSAELREQLDQEHTALLASIDEVQGLVEAEVAHAGSGQTLPSLEELDAFIGDVESLLRLDVTRTEVRHCSIAAVARSSACAVSRAVESTAPKHGSDVLEDCLEGEASCIDVESCASHTAELGCSELERQPASPSASLSFGADASRDINQMDVIAHAIGRPSRPRWADIASDSDEPREHTDDQQKTCPAADGCGSTVRANCSNCGQLLTRAAFSRRAWRFARDGPCPPKQPGHLAGASCLACAQRAPKVPSRGKADCPGLKLRLG